MALQQQGSTAPSLVSSGSSSSALEYREALARALAEDLPRVQIETASPAAPRRSSTELPRNTTPAETLSFKLFDGQSLQYADHICNGVYDIWGGFVGTEDDTPVARFPSLDLLSRIPYISGDTREVVLVDQREDARLREIHARALELLDGCQSAGALACVQELAQLVAEIMGGAGSHADLSRRYATLSQILKAQRNSLVLPIGELTVGLSRHRSLLLKTLADSCDLPCRILRGDFYLGAAGHSGENSVVMLQFNGREWMVELVTEPGRLYQVKTGSIPRPAGGQLWDFQSRRAADMASHNPSSSTRGFPTLPKVPKTEPDEETSSTGTTISSGQKEGLQWSEMDGPTMEDLGRSEEDAEASMPLDASTGGRRTDSEDSQGQWQPWDQDSLVKVSPAAQFGPLETVDAVKPGKYGSTPHGTGPARARVRGKDARGRMVELELEGLTVTHAHNLEIGNRSLDTMRPMPRRSEDHSRASRSLESMISRFRVLDSNRGQRGSGETQRQSGEASSSRDPQPWNVGSLAHHEDQTSARSLQDSEGQGASELRDEMRQYLQGKRPGLSEPQLKEGQAWEQRMREHYLPDSNPGSSVNAPQARSGQPLPEQVISPQAAQKLVSNLLSDPSLGQLLGPSAAQARGKEPDEGHPPRLGGDGNPVQAPKKGKSSETISSSNPLGSNSEGGNKSGSGKAVSLPTSSPGGSGNASSGAASSAERFSKASEANLAELRAKGDAMRHNPRVKEHRSSNSTFYDMMGMASTARELNYRRLQAPFERSSEQEDRSSTIQMPGSGNSDPYSDSSAAEADEAEVEFSEIELGPRIGVGCFGEVFKARWRQTTVAVKRLFDQSLSDQTLREFKAEVQLNRRLKHPNVIMFMGACTKPPNLSIITQWAPKGSLFQLLHNPKPGQPPLPLRKKLRMALDIARGMHYLHSARPPVIHRDLKSMNLLVDNDLSIKVCDFGLARIRSSTWMTGRSQGGTPEWTAPEVLRNSQYNEKSDVYSYGVVLYEIATEKEPWDEMTPMQVVGAVGWAGNRLDPPPDCPPIFSSLMLRCFQGPEERPSFDTVIQELLQNASETQQ